MWNEKWQYSLISRSFVNRFLLRFAYFWEPSDKQATLGRWDEHKEGNIIKTALSRMAKLERKTITCYELCASKTIKSYRQ